MSFIKFTVSTVLIALFSIALITFAANFAEDNQASISIADDPDLSGLSTGMQNDINDFYVSANTSADAFGKSTISSQTEASEGGTQYKVTPTNSLSMARRSINAGFKKIFGTDSGFGIVFTALVATLGLIAAAYSYKAWVGRDPG